MDLYIANRCGPRRADGEGAMRDNDAGSVDAPWWRMRRPGAHGLNEVRGDTASAGSPRGPFPHARRMGRGFDAANFC